MKKITLALVATLVLTSGIFLLRSHLEKSNKESDATAVRAVVESYIKADLNGATLGTDNFEKSGLDRILIPGEEVAPGWDNVSLVKAYKINSIQTRNEKGRQLAIVSVAYEVVGEVPGAVEVIKNNETENYQFRLVKQNKEWKLIEPYDLRPHVSIETVIKHLKNFVGDEGQEKVPEVIHQLEEMKGNITRN